MFSPSVVGVHYNPIVGTMTLYNCVRLNPWLLKLDQYSLSRDDTLVSISRVLVKYFTKLAHLIEIACNETFKPVSLY